MKLGPLSEIWKTTTNLATVQWFIGTFLISGTNNAIKNRGDDFNFRKKALSLTADHSRAVLGRLGIETSLNSIPDELKGKNFFMVCNHMSYVDILVLSANQSSVFVTSVEMEKTFFLGDLAKLGGSFFVNRVNRRKLKEEVGRLKDLVAKGLNVFVFPEGTSTNGMSGILPFRKSLFRVPFEAGIPILPICLKYKSIDGEPFSQKNCDRVSWHGDMAFAPHFMQLMKIRKMQVEIEYLKPLYPENYKNHGEISLAAFEQVQAAYGIPSSWS